ncbi:unnamed protein product [Medioppia subpectinata]|uniref:TNFR-Cys domain-containing protein n=1 Tax=Medioppia subpectinata TaxID=1979941 RepID=A0A7R9KBR7_9ACAR|nr:unnamed protein product [Medioppia subpectinata]CAG2100272.1 unnamed protein product [Medioppia subpectinata]
MINIIQFILIATLVLKCVVSIEDNNSSADSDFDTFPTQTNCSFNDLKCILSRHRISSNITTEFSDDNNNDIKNSTLDSQAVNECHFGETYYDLERKQCVNCSADCPLNSKIHKRCNGTHDTQCVCNSGHFMAVDHTCKPCTQCESGWGKGRGLSEWVSASPALVVLQGLQ